MSAAPAARRHRFSFSLRSMFVLITVLAIWLGIQVNRTRREEQAIASIEALSGQVIFDASVRPYAKWLQPLFGRGRIRGVGWRQGQITDADLKDLRPILEKLPKFEVLSFGGTSIGDATLERIKDLRSFRILNIDSTHVTDAGLEYLIQMPNLEHLTIVYADQLTDEGLKRLTTSASLKQVTFGTHSKQVTQAGWDAVNSIGRAPAPVARQVR